MIDLEKVVNEIKTHLKKNAPALTKDQKSRMYKILNPDNPNFIGYGNKHSNIEKMVREIHNNYQLSYQDSSEIFKYLIKSNVHDEKIAGLFLLNRSKKEFNKDTVKMIYDIIPKNFDTWAITDTTMIRIIGYGPDKVKYLKYAEEKGLGIADLDKIEIIGNQIKDVYRKF